MHKNLVIIHLESISNLILNMNLNQFPNTVSLMNESLCYTNYFSTATSTFMVWSDIAYGNWNLLENTRDFKELTVNPSNGPSLFDFLIAKGYATKVVSYPKDDHTKLINDSHLFGVDVKIENYADYDNFIKNIGKHILENKKFAIHINNIISNLSYFDKEKRKGKTSLEQSSIGYKGIDHTLGEVVNILSKKGLLKNTVILVYGDHGDDFWGHRFNNGATHATDCYAMLLNTPLFIYDQDRGAARYDDLLSAVDLRDKVIRLLGFETKMQSKRNYCFARNLFANQKDNGKYNDFKKSYSVMNKNYSLLLTRKGLEMYLHKMDYTSSCNILNFFQMKKGKLSYICNGKFHGHFLSFMNHSQIKDIVKNFYFLRKNLIYEMINLYKSNEIRMEARIRKNALNKIHYMNRPKWEMFYINHIMGFKDLLKWRG